jgi:predicted dehydrogenase
VESANYRAIDQVPLDQYDAALVCTPDDAKYDLLFYLLQHRKHVLVEKPLLMTDDRLRKLKSMTGSEGVTCYTAYNHRFEPHIVEVHRLLQSGSIGRVYQARFFYGNGTAMDVKRSVWRDTGMGVLPDLGSHLFDMCLFLFGSALGDFRPWTFNNFENRAFDHFACGSDGVPVIELEMSLLSWRNTFTADMYGELGSLHINGLWKWGPSVLTMRKRVLPSGRPQERTYSIESPDPTWAAEYRHFRDLCRKGVSNIENDLWILSALHRLQDRVQAASTS